MKKRTTQALIISIVTFMTFYILIRFVLGNDLDLENILAMLIYSLIVGLIGFAMNHFNLKIAYTLFLVGHFFGLGFMGYAYMSDVSGWEEIIGFLSYMIFFIGGFVLGLLIQGITYLYKRYKA